MYLLKGEKAPDHNTIARFRKDHLTCCVEGLLTQLVNLLAEADEIQFENLFIDGTKIEANANKYSFVWLAMACPKTRFSTKTMFQTRF